MTESEQPFIARGKSLLEQLLAMAQTRLEMLSTEIQQEKLALAAQVRLAAIAGICSLLAGFTLIIWIALALPPERRLVGLGVVFLVLVAIAVISILALRRHAQRPPLFRRVIHQVQLDRATLGPGT